CAIAVNPGNGDIGGFQGAAGPVYRAGADVLNCAGRTAGAVHGAVASAFAHGVGDRDELVHPEAEVDAEEYEEDEEGKHQDQLQGCLSLLTVSAAPSSLSR